VDHTYLIGLAAGLVSGLFYGGMTLTSRYLKDFYTGTAQGAWALLITLLIFSPYSAAITPKILLDNLAVLVLFGLIPTALALVLYLSGLMQVRAQNASIVALLEPASAEKGNVQYSPSTCCSHNSRFFVADNTTKSFSSKGVDGCSY